MYNHHKQSINNVVDKLSNQDEVLAILLSGSIAHGFEEVHSDVDIMIIIDENHYEVRKRKGQLNYFDTENVTYDGGYIDGKYITVDFMKKVSMKGSEPARYAFEGCKILYSNIEDLDDLLKKIYTYPVDRKNENIKRFYAQFEAWKWYCEEAIKKDDNYLLHKAVSNFVLYGGRMVLAYNEVLYPYHKWFIKVLSKVNNKPENLIELIDNLLEEKSTENINKFYSSIYDFMKCEEMSSNWPHQFLIDSELNWMTGNTPVEDL